MESHKIMNKFLFILFLPFIFSGCASDGSPFYYNNSNGEQVIEYADPIKIEENRKKIEELNNGFNW